MEIDETYVRRRRKRPCLDFKLNYPDLLLLFLAFLCCVVFVNACLLIAALAKVEHQLATMDAAAGAAGGRNCTYI